MSLNVHFAQQKYDAWVSLRNCSSLDSLLTSIMLTEKIPGEKKNDHYQGQSF